MQRINLGIVGVGKIVHDQHLPAIAKNESFKLLATASRNGSVDGVPAYISIEEMVAAEPELDAVALCMPPQYRYSAAQFSLKNGLHTLLEKPPGATVCEVELLAQFANLNKLSLFATWHSRHGAAVQTAKRMVASLDLISATVNWKEDVKKWHPGQEWIWQAGGLGVFDPGINGLSILTEILPSPVSVKSSKLVFPENKAAPIAAQMEFLTVDQVPVKLDFDWRERETEEWTISLKGHSDTVLLTDGGANLLINDQQETVVAQNEYESIYQRFADLIAERKSDVDLSPLKLTADAFMIGERRLVEPFSDN